MPGFLQDFVPRSYTAEQDDNRCISIALGKAVELAMLGLTDTALAIFSIVYAHSSFPESPNDDNSTDKKFCLHALKSAHGTQMTEDELSQEQLQAVQDNTGDIEMEIDWANVTSEDYQRLRDHVEEIERTGLDLDDVGKDMTMSQALFGLCYMAKSLGRSQDVQALLTRMARRIHAEDQSKYLPMLSFAWPDYFLPGTLRAELGVDLAQLEDYASMVLDQTRSRLETGPVHPDKIYRDATMQELLAMLDKQTQEAPLDAESESEDDDDDKNKSNKLSESVVLKGATETEIKETEERLGHSLPEDLKAFYRLSNGTLPISDATDPGTRKRKFVPLGEMFMEQDDYMADYKFNPVPAFRLHNFPNTDDELKPWTGITAAGIAMYEDEDQSTVYTWIFDQPLIEQSKKLLQSLYERSDADQKARIDQAIIHVYGSRAAYDEMQYCIYVQMWGEVDSTIFPSFRSYLNRAVYDSKVDSDPSPLKLPSDN